MLLLVGCIADGNVWYGGGPLTVEIDGSETLPSVLEIPGMSAAEIEAALDSDPPGQGPGGSYPADPASVLAADGDPAWAAAWDRTGTWTGAAELHAWASVYDNAAPLVVCGHWLSWIGIAWMATDHPYPESPPFALVLASSTDTVVTGSADVSMPRTPGPLSADVSVDLACLGERVEVRVSAAPDLDDHYSEPHGGGWMAIF